MTDDVPRPRDLLEQSEDRPADPVDDPLADLSPAELDVIRLSETEAAMADPEWPGEPSPQG